MSQECWVLGAKRNKKEADFKKLQGGKPAISSCHLILALILNLHPPPPSHFIPGPSLHAFIIFYLHFCKSLLPPQCDNQSSYFPKADRTSPNSADMSEMTPTRGWSPAPPPALSLSVSQYTPWSSHTWRHQHICIILFVLSWMFFFLFSVWY